MAVVGELLVLIGANNGPLTAAIASSEAQMRGFGSTTTTAMAGIRMAALGVGVAAVAGLGIAANAAGDFQEQMGIINTIAHQTPAELDKTGQAIIAMSTKSGTGLNDLTSAFYDLLSAGIKPGAAAINALGLANTLAIGGLATTKQTVDLLTTAINAYRLNTQGAKVATDQFALAIQDGKVTADQIAATFADVAPLAKTAGVGIDEISTSYAVLTARGTPAAEAMTQMNRVMIELLKPNADLTALQDKLGVSFAKVAADKGLVVALEEMRKGAEANHIPFQNLFGRLEGLKFALATTGPAFDTYESELTKMHDATGTAAVQAEERMGTFNRQVAILGTTLNAAAISVGTALLPALTTIAGMASDAGKAFTAWSDANPGLASNILLVVAAVAGLVVAATSLGAILGIVGTAVGIITSPITLLVGAVTGLAAHFGLLGSDAKNAVDGIGGAISSLLPTTGPLRDIFDGIGSALDAIPAVVGTVQSAFDGLAGTVGTVASAIGGFVTNADVQRTALTAIGQAADAVRPALSFVADAIRTVVAAIVGFVTNANNQRTALSAIGTAADIARAAIGWLGQAISTVVGWLGNFVTHLLGGEQGAKNASNAFNGMASTVGKIAGAIAPVIGAVAKFVGGIVDAANKMGVFKVAGDVINTAFGLLGDLIRTVIGLFTQLATVVGSGVSTAFNILKGVFDGILGAIRAVGDAIGGLVQKAKDAIDAISKIPGIKLGADVAGGIGDVWSHTGGGLVNNVANAVPHAAGVWNVGADHLAYVHAGEMVIPRAAAEQARSSSGGGRNAASPVHLTHTTILQVEGRSIAQVVEEVLFNNASAFSSGFADSPVTT